MWQIEYIVFINNYNLKLYFHHIYSCRAYVELDDSTGKLAAVMFGEIAKEALACSIVEFMNNTDEYAFLVFVTLLFGIK